MKERNEPHMSQGFGVGCMNLGCRIVGKGLVSSGGSGQGPLGKSWSCDALVLYLTVDTGFPLWNTGLHWSPSIPEYCSG